MNIEHLKVIHPISEYDLRFIHQNVLNKNFSHFEKIGCGFVANVYRYKNYAIKIYRSKNSPYNKDGEILEVLQDNPIFPKLFHYIKNKYVVMEYIEGKTLSKHISNFTLKRNSPINQQLDNLILYCHNKNIFPDDIHAKNIIIDKEGNIRVIDVGHYELEEPNPLLKEHIDESFLELQNSIDFYFTYACRY